MGEGEHDGDDDEDGRQHWLPDMLAMAGDDDDEDVDDKRDEDDGEEENQHRCFFVIGCGRYGSVIRREPMMFSLVQECGAGHARVCDGVGSWIRHH